MSTKFVIESGPEAGTYCSYCGEALTPAVDEVSGAFSFSCPCVYAEEERVLTNTINEYSECLSELQVGTARLRRRTFLERSISALAAETKTLQAELDALA